VIQAETSVTPCRLEMQMTDDDPTAN